MKIDNIINNRIRYSNILNSRWPLYILSLIYLISISVITTKFNKFNDKLLINGIGFVFAMIVTFLNIQLTI